MVFAAFLFGGYLAFKFVFPLVAPFVFAFLLAVMIEPLVVKLSGILHISKNKSVFLVLFFVVLIGGGILTFLITKIIVELNVLANNLPHLVKEGNQIVNDSINFGQGIYKQLPSQVTNFLNDNSKSILDEAGGLGNSLARDLLNLFTSLPKMIFISIFTIFLTYFMVRDKARIKEFLLKPLSHRHHRQAMTLYKEALKVGGKYLRVQLFLIILTIVINLAVLLALNVNYAIIISFAVGIASIVPAVGTGLVYVPWIIFLFLSGATPLAWYILGLFLFLLGGRHILEPKMLADTFDISALPMLFGMYVGFKLSGLEGMLIGIAVVVFYQILRKARIITEN